ncbi:short chain dehydrogenase reductase family protein [Stylonychia lemnae]|uniref:Short chain dehydrogenase reductase family protein n=1 Tax=Stylonychia lemnae TaxID=5949 RepID=A0A078A8N4_STYLE|nr:short chain dehydrogenase reductase family protein [Stylonychia lemnae]|eukprot:CDW78589.1 short chain dehydrogenase reductase family protein [Stylonychia lemnae]
MFEYLQQLLHYFKHSKCTLYVWIYYLAFAIGAYYLVLLGIFVLQFLNKHIIRRRLDLLKRYGSNSWALVTGASDGFGAEYCRQLAKDGFNIVLVSRTMSKLQAVEQELKKINPKIQTKIVQADFTGNANVQFYQNIFDQVNNLDISILVNNAGIMLNGRVDLIKPKALTDTIDVNVVQVCMMTSVFLPKLLARKPRSAIINVSSMIGFTEAYAGDAVYCASKAYVNFFTYAFAEEVKDRIDIQLFTPGMGATNLWGNASKSNLLGISANSVVYGSLRDLGREVNTSGHWNHEVQSPAMKPLSQSSIFQYFANKIYGISMLEK